MTSIDVSDSYTLDRYNFYGVLMTITSPPWAGYGVTRSFSWAPRFACTRPLWCPFCYMLQKPGHYFRVTKKYRDVCAI